MAYLVRKLLTLVCWLLVPKLELGNERIPVVMPAKAGIQGLLLDFRQEHAGMTTWGNGHFILLCCIKFNIMKALSIND